MLPVTVPPVTVLAPSAVVLTTFVPNELELVSAVVPMAGALVLMVGPPTGAVMTSLSDRPEAASYLVMVVEVPVEAVVLAQPVGVDQLPVA